MMSIRSMTGYGQSVASSGDAKVSVELRAVNHRFAEFHIRLPREWLSLEDEVRRVLGDFIRRGRVDVFISVESNGAAGEVVVNWPLVDAFIDAERQLLQRFGREIEANTVRDWLKHPEVTQIRAVLASAEDMETALVKAVTEAAEQLVDMRTREGLRLHENFLEKLSELRSHLDVVLAYDRSAVERRREQLQARLRQLQVDVDPDRLAQEVVLLVDRGAVDEEIVRLTSHIEAFDETLGQAGSIGKKLDFIVQEMLREVNTIGSKSADAGIAKAVVEMKVLIEQLREQVQNVE